MSEHKQATSETPKSKSPKVGNSGSGQGSAKGRRNLFAAVFVCLILVLAGVGGWYFYKQHHHKTTVATTKTAPVDVSKLNSEQQYRYYASSGNYTAAQDALNSQLASATDTATKQSLYFQKATIAEQYKKYDDAETFAAASMKLDSTTTTPYVTYGFLRKAQGKNADAKNYFQQAIDHLDKNSQSYDLVLSEYQQYLQGVS